MMISGYQDMRVPGYQTTQMFQRAGQATGYPERQKIKDEFLAIFYKELLKQTFKPPKLGMDENSRSFAGVFTSDILVEKLALELAQSKSFSIDGLFPTAAGRDIVTE